MLDALELLDRDKAAAPFTPATVPPPARPLTALQSMATARRNMIEIMDEGMFDERFRHVRSLGQWYLLVYDPELAQAVLLDHADAFGRAEAQQRVFRPALGEGLLVAEGAEWRRQRRAASPAFRHESLRRMTSAFTEVAEMRAARLARLGASGPVDVEQEMRQATLDVVLKSLLAVDDDSLEAVSIARTLNEYGEAMATPDLLDLLGAPGWVPRPWRARQRRQLVAMRAAARDALERRRAGPDKGDLLSALIAARDPESGRGLTDEQLVDNILTFIGAGYETTAVLMTWALYLVANAPAVQDRLLAEAREVLGDGPVTADALEGLRFHEQVLNEALRLFTPGPILLRTATRDVDLGPVKVTKGTQVFCYLYVLHRSRRLWENPAAFDPDRFSPRALGRPAPLRLHPLRRGPRRLHRRPLRHHGSQDLPGDLRPRPGAGARLRRPAAPPLQADAQAGGRDAVEGRRSDLIIPWRPPASLQRLRACSIVIIPAPEAAADPARR
jgi:cytochrome P450